MQAVLAAGFLADSRNHDEQYLHQAQQALREAITEAWLQDQQMIAVVLADTSLMSLYTSCVPAAAILDERGLPCMTTEQNQSFVEAVIHKQSESKASPALSKKWVLPNSPRIYTWKWTGQSTLLYCNRISKP